MELIKIDNLTRDYGKGRGVFDLDLSVDEGEVFGFLGPNGAGKTTAIRHLMGFLKPEKGRCSIHGLDCWKSAPKIQNTLGYIPGEMAFPDDMTGAGFLLFYQKYRGMKTAGRMAELQERFELDASGKIKKMSKGMKQKIGIVAAFMHDPDVLILDEPTSGLDPLMQNRFIDLILEEKQRGKTILMSSHMFEEVERTCHRVGIIRDGRIVVVDDINSIKAKQTRRYIVTFEDEGQVERFSKEPFQIESREGARVTVSVQNNLQAFITVLSNYSVVNLTAPGQSLEEIFLQYYGGAK